MSDAQFISVLKPSHPIYQVLGDKPFINLLIKEIPSTSRQTSNIGEKDTPFNFGTAIKFKNANVHHSTCIETKKESTVGIGFETDKVEDTLQPICSISFQDVLGDVAEDYWSTGNGYMEVVRVGKDIVGLYHLPTNDVRVVIEDETMTNIHYKIAGSDQKEERRFAKFGDLEGFLARRKAGIITFTGFSNPNPSSVSEVIHFRRPTSLSRFYGYPDWLAATASIELVQCLHQHNFDFFLNRGVPEFLLFFLGAKIPDNDWKQIQEMMKKHIGYGNQFKSSAINLIHPIDNFKVQLEKLALEGKTGETLFKDMSETLAINIVSAHRVPPLLAGILIPGKLGATNELPNALMAFQILVIGPAQHQIATILKSTLGDKNKNGGLGLAPDNFKFKKITDLINIQEMDTVSRMREPASNTDRNLSEGLRKMLAIAAEKVIEEASINDAA